MLISEYISALQKILDEHGDLAVESYSSHQGRITASSPRISYRLISLGRERRSKFYQSYQEECRKGEKVCEI